MNKKTSQDSIAYIRQLLDSNEVERAFQYINKKGTHKPELRNALGVCLLRLGETEKAVGILRELVFQKHLSVPKDTPPLFQANYATALLIKRYNQMAIEIIKTLSPSTHPYIGRLHDAIVGWRKNLPLYRRILFKLGLYPNTRIVLNFPPGQI